MCQISSATAAGRIHIETSSVYDTVTVKPPLPAAGDSSQRTMRFTCNIVTFSDRNISRIRGTCFIPHIMYGVRDLYRSRCVCLKFKFHPGQLIPASYGFRSLHARALFRALPVLTARCLPPIALWNYAGVLMFKLPHVMLISYSTIKVLWT